MGNIQYAVCHLQRGSGNDSGVSCHIERKTADGKVYIPDNADKTRTHLNRELIQFPPAECVTVPMLSNIASTAQDFIARSARTKRKPFG